MHIGIITSMKRGLASFIHREILYLEREGATISLFPTKYQTEHYNAEDSWHLYPWHWGGLLMAQGRGLLHSPRRYLSLLLEAIRYRGLSECMLAWYFAQYMKDIDAIYAIFGDKKFFVGYFCQQILQKPLAVAIHAYELYTNPNPPLFQRAMQACDQLITISDHNREWMDEHYGIEPQDVEIVRYSLDLQEFRPANKFVILIVGFFVERKGHEILFQAIQRLNNPNLEVWVVGDEGAEDSSVDVRTMVNELGIESQVAFFGKLSGPALKAVYHACDLFCLPCRTESSGVCEGFPNVLIEAMACGKPVLTTRHVEIPRIISEILVDENDVDGLADAIDLLYQSPELRQRLAEQNRVLAETHFAETNTAKTYQLLANMAKDSPPADREPSDLSETTVSLPYQTNQA